MRHGLRIGKVELWTFLFQFHKKKNPGGGKDLNALIHKSYSFEILESVLSRLLTIEHRENTY